MSKKTTNWLLSWKANNRALQMPRHSLSTTGCQYLASKNYCTYNCTPMWFTLFKRTVCLGGTAKLACWIFQTIQGRKVALSARGRLAGMCPGGAASHLLFLEETGLAA